MQIQSSGTLRKQFDPSKDDEKEDDLQIEPSEKRQK